MAQRPVKGGHSRKEAKVQRFREMAEDPEWWDTWFNQITQFGAIRKLLDGYKIPYREYYQYLKDHPEIGERHEAAMRDHAAFLASKITDNANALDQSDAANPDPKKAKIAIDAYQWLASRYDPDRYGERQKLDVQTTDLTQVHLEAIRELSMKQLDQKIKVVNPTKELEDHGKKKG